MLDELDESGRLVKIKDFWQKYKILIISSIISIIIAAGAWIYLDYLRNKQAINAAILYEQLEHVWAKRDAPRVIRIIEDIQKKYPKTSYAQLASLYAAKILSTSNNIAAAKLNLNWVISSGKDAGFRYLANLHLSHILLDEKHYEEALQLLAIKIPKEFVSLYAQSRGDIFFTKGEIAKARSQYQLALANLDLNKNIDNEQKQIINLKLDLVGN